MLLLKRATRRVGGGADTEGAFHILLTRTHVVSRLLATSSAPAPSSPPSMKLLYTDRPREQRRLRLRHICTDRVGGPFYGHCAAGIGPEEHRLHVLPSALLLKAIVVVKPQHWTGARCWASWRMFAYRSKPQHPGARAWREKMDTLGLGAGTAVENVRYLG